MVRWQPLGHFPATTQFQRHHITTDHARTFERSVACGRRFVCSRGVFFILASWRSLRCLCNFGLLHYDGTGRCVEKALCGWLRRLAGSRYRCIHPAVVSSPTTTTVGEKGNKSDGISGCSSICWRCFRHCTFSLSEKMLIFDTQIILWASGFSPFIHRGFWTTRHTLWMCLPLCFLAPLHFSPISSSPKLEGCRRAQCLSAIVANMGENGNAL